MTDKSFWVSIPHVVEGSLDDDDIILADRMSVDALGCLYFWKSTGFSGYGEELVQVYAPGRWLEAGISDDKKGKQDG